MCRARLAFPQPGGHTQSGGCFYAAPVLSSRVPKSFRTGFYAGALLAVALGIYLFRLWSAERQIELHTSHLLRSLEARDFQKFASFIAPDYRDRWEEDRAIVLQRTRVVFGYLRGVQLRSTDPVIRSSGADGSWEGRVELMGAENSELATLIKERLNNVRTPFRLDWRRQSGKPWDWQLVRVSNDNLEIPAGNGYLP